MEIIVLHVIKTILLVNSEDGKLHNSTCVFFTTSRLGFLPGREKRWLRKFELVSQSVSVVLRRYVSAIFTIFHTTCWPLKPVVGWSIKSSYHEYNGEKSVKSKTSTRIKRTKKIFDNSHLRIFDAPIQRDIPISSTSKKNAFRPSARHLKRT